jgi:hypothetical protein
MRADLKDMKAEPLLEHDECLNHWDILVGFPLYEKLIASQMS